METIEIIEVAIQQIKEHVRELSYKLVPEWHKGEYDRSCVRWDIVDLPLLKGNFGITRGTKFYLELYTANEYGSTFAFDGPDKYIDITIINVNYDQLLDSIHQHDCGYF